MKKIGAVSFVVIVAVGAGFQTANQAGIFWGLVVGGMIAFFGLMAFAPVVGRV